MLEKARKTFILFCTGGFLIILGYSVHRFEFFPFKQIEETGKGLASLFQKEWYYRPTTDTSNVRIFKSNALDWPTLITSIDQNDSLVVKVVENDGRIIHKWNVEWFELWNDANHIPTLWRPRGRPGAMIHGVEMLENGSIIFNIENLGLICVDKSGALIWRLPHLTHHSIHRDGDVIWVCSQRYHTKAIQKFPNFVPPFIEPTILKVSISGELIDEISVLDLLFDNKLQGLVYMPTTTDLHTRLTGDIFHLNDVETFPENMQEGFFCRGDIMISLRNINTILFFNDSTKAIKNITFGDFVRQHDPDFVDGNTISIFDNNNSGSRDKTRQSRILIKSFTNNKYTEYYCGTNENPFNSTIMGKHQWLINGNLLITDTMNGRAFEINADKQIVWEYVNLLPNHIKGIIQEATKIPRPYINTAFSAGLNL